MIDKSTISQLVQDIPNDRMFYCELNFSGIDYYFSAIGKKNSIDIVVNNNGEYEFINIVVDVSSIELFVNSIYRFFKING